MREAAATQTAQLCIVVAVLAGASGPPRPPAKAPVSADPRPVAPDEKRADRDGSGSLKPVCTIRVAPADPGLDPVFAQPVQGTPDPGMVVPSRCRPVD